ncbi:LacI family DNA-binding transcriptional regulator [Aerococcus urinae]
MTTLKDIAKATGYSVSTISRVLREDPTLSVKSSTRQEITAVAQAMNYVIRGVSSQAYDILVIHKDDHFRDHIDNAYYFNMRFGIESIIHEYGYTCYFVPISRLKKFKHSFDGILLLGNFSKAEQKDIVTSYRNYPIVTVCLMNFFPSQMDQVVYDIEKAIELLLNQVVDEGYHSMVYVSGEEIEDAHLMSSKEQILRAILPKYPTIDCQEIISIKQSSYSGTQAAKKFFSQSETLPEVIICSNDPIAFGFLGVMQDLKINIPLLSINGDSYGEVTTPQLTSVDVKTEEIGQVAVERLLERLKEPQRPYQKVLIQPQMLLRQSHLP